MTEKTRNAIGKGLARRRLLRGTFAAPAVLTLVSGSALAATSVSCVVKRVDSPLDAPDSPTSAWLRVPLYQTGGFPNLARFVRGSDLVSLMPPGGSYLIGVDTWQCVAIDGTGAGFSVGTTYTTGIDPMTTAPTLLPGGYVAVRVDGNGMIVGIQGLPGDTGNSAIHVSCWTSFGGTAAFP